MNNKTEPSGASHIYPLKWWFHLWHIIFIVFLWIVWGNVLYFFGNVLLTLFNAGDQVTASTLTLPLLVSIIFIIFSILAILLFTASAFLSSFSYMQITPEGITQKRYFPNKSIRCGWSDVDSLGKYLFADVLYLKPSESIGLPIFFIKLLKGLLHIQPTIPLSNYSGWPNGRLAADLEKYIPKIIEKKF